MFLREMYVRKLCFPLLFIGNVELLLLLFDYDDKIQDRLKQTCGHSYLLKDLEIQFVHKLYKYCIAFAQFYKTWHIGWMNTNYVRTLH